MTVLPTAKPAIVEGGLDQHVAQLLELRRLALAQRPGGVARGRHARVWVGAAGGRGLTASRRAATADQ